MREMKSPSPVRLQGRADPKYEVNQPVARSQTEDCYREIPRDSIWSEIRGGKHGARLDSRPGFHKRTIPRFRSNESIDKFGVSPHPVAALSLAVTFHVQRSPSFPIRFLPAKDKGPLCSSPIAISPPLCN